MTGKIYGCAIRAQMTLSFGLAKSGLMVGEGPEHVGRLRVVADRSSSATLSASGEDSFYLFMRN